MANSKSAVRPSLSSEAPLTRSTDKDDAPRTDKDDAPRELHAWLTTMQVDEGLGRGATIRPSESALQPLLRAFTARGAGSSAAPIEVGATLAEGGMGIVKIAEQPALGRTVVVKTLRGDFAKTAAEHILREAWATGALEHPNIVPVHDIRVDAHGTPVIVLKKIEGDCWTALMHQPELLRDRFGVEDPLTWNLDILRQVTQAIRYAHSRGILHRDLKPDNVMIGEFGEVYVVDWGIALSMRDNDSCPLPAASDQSAMAGTPCYLAPEMLGGRPLDARTDVYLLGAILFEILADRPPHRTDDLTTLLADITRSEPVIPEDAPPSLAEMCRKAMAAEPARRYQDANHFASALQVFAQTSGSQKLADKAREELAALEACLQEDGPKQQHEVYRYFGAARFGYESALATWPENASAKEEIDRARSLMIDYELSRGNAEAARGLLHEMHEPPTELQLRVDEALATQARESDELARFREDVDLNLGRQTRLVLTLVLGSLWTLMPLVEHVFGTAVWRNSFPRMCGTTIVLWLLCLGFWVWARESLTRTVINRRITLTVMVIFPSQLLLFAGASALKMPYVSAEILMVLLWAVVATSAVLTVERRFWPTMLAYACAFLFATHEPHYRFLAMAAANAIFTGNGLVIWCGRRQAKEERLAQEQAQEQAS